MNSAYNTDITELLKQEFQARWSQSKKYWWIARNEFDYKKFKAVFSVLADIEMPEKQVETKAKTEMKLPNGYLEKLQRVRYSESTIRTYTSYFKDFQKNTRVFFPS
ncbi:hypothetical protein [Ancylomarina euxinus]|uniref:hypothetical protein n=1 Tax=Ancylomarina euxinus TaxID=2283627 RepID=UPI0018CFB8A2|nr:hypothetical protein [Ancylomarina euxinus]MCZ4696492.1 hypothetical protein [Ancylomarina euxinus]